jgi:hypothetical protein
MQPSTALVKLQPELSWDQMLSDSSPSSPSSA